jgi:plasmid maintenance system antidote protein VapI
MDKLKKAVKPIKNAGKANALDVTIGPNDGNKWSGDKMLKITSLAKSHHSQRSPERLRRNAMLAVHYRMEHYVQDENITFENVCTVGGFVSDFLKVLGIKKGEFAKYIEMDNSNLNKYYRSDRRFNTVLALKFAHFFHTPADLWLKVQIKNELLELKREKETEEKYNKYDYEKLLQMA